MTLLIIGIIATIIELAVIICGHKNNGDIKRIINSFQSVDDIMPVHPRHMYIKKYQVRLFLTNKLQRFFSRSRFSYLKPAT